MEQIRAAQERNAALELTLQTVLDMTGADPDWLENAPCDSTKVKAGLFDLLLHRLTTSEDSLEKVRNLYKQFKKDSEAQFAEMAALKCLGCEQSASQVSFLVETLNHNSNEVKSPL